jgi:hypothetical protein
MAPDGKRFVMTVLFIIFREETDTGFLFSR